MKRLLQIFILLLFLLNYKQSLAWDFVYPIQTMSKPECRFQNFHTLWSECKMQLPVLETKDYKKLKDDFLYRRVYTVLWGATYTYGWDVWNWSHLWVDIASAKWTPVHAISDWIVHFSGWKSWWWNTVVIKHQINWKTIYSNYWHLSKLKIEKWTKVKTGDKIWEVWTSWNSTWNHLHFQIDTNIDTHNHPFFYTYCPDGSKNIVNNWYCRDNFRANTIDPLAFLETSWAIIYDMKNAHKEKVFISKKEIETRKQIQEKEVKQFLKYHDISFKINPIWWYIKKWDYADLIISVKKRNKDFSGIFPDYLHIWLSNSNINSNTKRILAIDKWKRIIKIRWVKDWNSKIYLRLWKHNIKTLNLRVIDKKSSLDINSSILYTKSKIYSSEKRKGIMILSENKSPVIWYPYSWNYYISSKKWYIRFCFKKAKTIKDLNYKYKSDCYDKYYLDKSLIKYENSFMWIYVFDYIFLWVWDDTIQVKDDKWNIIKEKNISAILPKIDKKSPYKDEIKLWLESWFFSDSIKWWFHYDMLLSQDLAYSMIRNSLIKLKSKSKSEKLDNIINSNISKLDNIKKTRFKKITRLEFLKLLDEYLFLSDKDSKDNIKFRDLDTNQNKLANKLFDKNNTWKDKFWKTHFQPNKNLNRGEGIYMLIKALMKV